MFGLHPKDWNTDDVKMNSHRVDSPPPLRKLGFTMLRWQRPGSSY